MHCAGERRNGTTGRQHCALASVARQALRDDAYPPAVRAVGHSATPGGALAAGARRGGPAERVVRLGGRIRLCGVAVWLHKGGRGRARRDALAAIRRARSGEQLARDGVGVRPRRLRVARAGQRQRQRRRRGRKCTPSRNCDDMGGAVPPRRRARAAARSLPCAAAKKPHARCARAATRGGGRARPQELAAGVPRGPNATKHPTAPSRADARASRRTAARTRSAVAQTAK